MDEDGEKSIHRARRIGKVLGIRYSRVEAPLPCDRGSRGEFIIGYKDGGTAKERNERRGRRASPGKEDSDRGYSSLSPSSPPRREGKNDE